MDTLFVLAQGTTPAPNVITLDPTTIALVTTSLITLISALVGGVVAIISAIRMGQVNKAQDALGVTASTIARDTEAIKGHVNSEKTAAEGREAALRTENHMLREIVADKKATAQLLAQAKATERVASAVGAAGATGAAGPAGVSGATGERGATGLTGEQGTAGERGTTGASGMDAASPLATDSVAQSLERIDLQTAAIEQNTKKAETP